MTLCLAWGERTLLKFCSECAYWGQRLHICFNQVGFRALLHKFTNGVQISVKLHHQP